IGNFDRFGPVRIGSVQTGKRANNIIQLFEETQAPTHYSIIFLPFPLLHIQLFDPSPAINSTYCIPNKGTMTEAFEGYERQYCQTSANLSKKCSSAALLDGEKKKQKIFEIRAGIDEAESLIRKMDLEARSLQPNVKGMLLAKLREYKSDLNNLKSEVKKLSSGNSNLSARDELLESGMADTMANPFKEIYVYLLFKKLHSLIVSSDQRARLLVSTGKLNQTSDRVRDSRRTMLETEELGVSILQDLHGQRQALLQAHNTLHGVDDNISRSKKIMNNMSRRMGRNKWIISGIVAVLLIVIALILYFKLK
ncbi:LOW QUALITY PROTEIN: hypothetical protein V2J09_017433, partial [Rumex salicifolius]